MKVDDIVLPCVREDGRVYVNFDGGVVVKVDECAVAFRRESSGEIVWRTRTEVIEASLIISINADGSAVLAKEAI